MASRRMEKMASSVRNVISDAIRNKLNDPRISPHTCVTRVEMSGDLQIARVFVSVMGSDVDSRRTMSGLEHAVGHLQRIVAAKIRTRYCPQIQLRLDESLKRAAEMLDLINQSAPDPLAGPESEVTGIDDVDDTEGTRE